MKKLLWGIVYTVVVAAALSHLSGCDVPSFDAVTSLLSPAPSNNETPEVIIPTATAAPTAQININEDVDVPEEEKVTVCDDYVWTTGSVNLRSGAGKDYDKCGTVPGNTKVHRTGICNNGWILIEYKGITAYISGKYYTSLEPASADDKNVSTATPTITSTPTPVIPTATSTPMVTVTSVPRSTPTTAVITAQPTHGPSTAPVVDDVDGLLLQLTKVNNAVDTKSAADFYYETEKSATGAFRMNADQYTTFAMLYKNKSCMHTPEYLMSVFPELYSVTIDYEQSKVFTNAIYVIYNVVGKEGGQFSYAIRTGDTSLLSEEEKWALKRAMSLSDELGLKNMSDIDKVRTVHDYLINNTSYDQDKRKASHSPYGLLHDHLAVCDGYAEAFMMFMLLNDVECQTVTGYANENHAWNQVRLDGQWYNIDVTWDDPVTTDENGRRIETIRYTYYLVNDAIFTDTHVSLCGYEEKCTSDKYHLIAYEPYICKSTNEVKDSINRQLSNEFIYVIYEKDTFSRNSIIKIFQSIRNVSVQSYEPEEVREGYYMVRIINPLV